MRFSHLPTAYCLRFPRSPGAEDGIDLVTDLGAGSGAVGASHQNFVVIRVPVADGGDDGEANAFILQSAAGGGAANASTAALGGVLGDGASFLRRASWEAVEDSKCQRGGHLFIVVNAASQTRS